MTTLNFTPSACYEKVQDLNNNQVSLLSGSLPEAIKTDLLEYQQELIGELSTMLLMLDRGLTLDSEPENLHNQ